jgi:glyoxylase-like metal-dependent hydrolase (beta-lactamase superfamily II)
VQGSLHLIAGPGGNVIVEVSDEGLLVVDTGAPGNTAQLNAAIRSISDKTITSIINTSADADHVGSNEALASAGGYRGGNAPGNFGFQIDTAAVIAHENVLKRVSAPTGETGVLPFAGWPTSTYFTERKTMFFGEEPIEIIAQPSAHTDGDSIVFFRRSDVIAAGDVFMTDRYPVIDLARGGSLQGIIDGLNRIIDIAIPRFNQQGGTLIVPGHGRIGNESDVVEYRDMATIVRDRIRLMVERGLSLDEVKAARATLDYDGVYGASDGPWTTDMFVEAVYRDLRKPR